MAFVVGIDGGGTKTRAVVADHDGKFISMAMSGPSNPKAIGLEEAAGTVASVIRKAFASAGLTSVDVDVLQIGLAGVRTEHDREAFTTALLPKLSSHGCQVTELLIVNDLEIALVGGTGGASGIVLVAGTGSASLGRNETGQVAQAGGWGWYIDDPGSGYWFGYRAMAAAARASDGRGEPTSLQEAVRTFLRIRSIDEMPNVIYNRHFSRERVAELAPLVLQAATEGDSVAMQIRAEGAAELALMVNAVVERLSLPSPQQVVISGGVALSGEAFTQVLGIELLKLLPHARVGAPLFPPVIGAICLALQHLGLKPEPARLSALASDLHSAQIAGSMSGERA